MKKGKIKQKGCLKYYKESYYYPLSKKLPIIYKSVHADTVRMKTKTTSGNTPHRDFHTKPPKSVRTQAF